MHIFYIALGGALGAVSRYMTVSAAERFLGHGFPYGTLIVNVLGSVLMGIVVEYLHRNNNPNDELRLFLVIGLLGGYTTFSSFSLDSLKIWQDGNITAAVTYIGFSVGLSLVGIWAGSQIIRGIS